METWNAYFYGVLCGLDSSNLIRSYWCIVTACCGDFSALDQTVWRSGRKQSLTNGWTDETKLPAEIVFYATNETPKNSLEMPKNISISCWKKKTCILRVRIILNIHKVHKSTKTYDFVFPWRKIEKKEGNTEKWKYFISFSLRLRGTRTWYVRLLG